jgi:hypothetical protein
MEIDNFLPREYGQKRRKRIKIDISVLDAIKKKFNTLEKDLSESKNRISILQEKLYEAFIIIERLEKALESSKNHISIEKEISKLEHVLLISKKYIYANEFLKKEIFEIFGKNENLGISYK